MQMIKYSMQKQMKIKTPAGETYKDQTTHFSHQISKTSKAGKHPGLVIIGRRPDKTTILKSTQVQTMEMH